MSEKEDVAAVLARLKQEVRRQKPAGAGTSPAGRAVDLRRVYATTRVNPHLPIGWPKMPPGILPKIVAIAQKLVRRVLRWYINPIVEQQNAYNSAVTAALESLVLQMERLEASLAQQNRQHQANLQELEIAKLRLQRLERAARQAQAVATPTSPDHPSPLPMMEHPPLDYFRLELKFRGPQLLKEQQKAYLEYFQGRENILDIGCGRGEFVELLVENGISAHGIDLNRDAVAYGVERDIPVEVGEALPYLESLPDESLGGIFCAQVVEHLQLNYLTRLLELCHDKLKPGAPIVVETINPTCLHALANAFMMDPTHVRPIHPKTLEFMLESAGFWRIQLKLLSPVPIENRLLAFPNHVKLHSIDAEAVSLLNRNIDILNHSLFGYQDYAAIAWRPPQDIGEGS